MPLQGLVLQTWPGVWACLSLLFLAAALWVLLPLLTDDAHEARLIFIIPTLLALVFLALAFAYTWFFASTHVIVPVDTVAVIESSATGQIDGAQRSPGVVDVPLTGAKVLLFPAQPNFQWCDEYHPSASGGIAVKITPCWILDASAINWQQELIRTGKESATDVLTQFHNPLSDVVASTAHNLTIEQMGDQAGVAASLKKAAGDVFAGEGIVLKSVSIQNWDFENPEIGKLYDQAAVSQTGKLKAEADQQAALAEKQAALTRAQTANDVLTLQTQALNQALTTLGVADSQSRANVLQLRMLLEFLTTHPSVTLIVSANGAPAISPIAANPQPGPTTTPQATANNK